MIRIADLPPLFDKDTRAPKSTSINLVENIRAVIPGSTVVFPDEETIYRYAKRLFQLWYYPCIINGVKSWTTLSNFVKLEELQDSRITIKRLAGTTIEVPEDVEEACKNGMSVFYFNRITKAVSPKSLLEGKDDILHYIWIFYPSLLDWAETWVLKLRELYVKRCNICPKQSL